MNILITGIAGFIGFNFAKKLIESKRKVKIIGIDNINNYYSQKLKKDRLNQIKKKIIFYKLDLSNKKKVRIIFKKHKIDKIYHFAAQAGVRYSIKFPEKYLDSNICSFFNLIEASRLYGVRNILYASSSSVYGEAKNFPLNEKEKINPKNFYGLSKKINEEMAELYAKYYKINFIGLRFFTVYGEWGRPDMSIFKIIDSSFQNKFFYLNNFGNHDRDFTYVQDVVNLIFKLKFLHNHKNTIYNISSNKPINLKKLLNIISKKIKLPKIIKRKMQKADVLKTHGDNKKIKKKCSYSNFTNISSGLDNTINWYKKYYLDGIK